LGGGRRFGFFGLRVVAEGPSKQGFGGGGGGFGDQAIKSDVISGTVVSSCMLGRGRCSWGWARQ